MIKLYSVHLSKISIDKKILCPTGWDNSVVYDDLRHYVNLSRLVAATPEIVIVEERIKLISGEPFVRAALAAIPPIEVAICQINNPGNIESIGLKAIDIKELQTQQLQNERETMCNALYFKKLLTHNELLSILKMLERASYDLGNPFKVFAQENNNKSVLQWTSLSRDLEDVRGRKFVSILQREIHPRAAISSWNGIAFNSSFCA